MKPCEHIEMIYSDILYCIWLFNYWQVLYLADSLTLRRPTSHCTMGGGTPDTSTDSVAGRPSVRVSGFSSCESSMCGAVCCSTALLPLPTASTWVITGCWCRVRRIVVLVTHSRYHCQTAASIHSFIHSLHKYYYSVISLTSFENTEHSHYQRTQQQVMR